MTLLDLLEVLSPELEIIVEYDDGELWISGYSVDFVKQQADYFDTVGDDTYKKLQVKDLTLLNHQEGRTLYVYCELLDE